MNSFFDVVDAVAKENGGTATLFVKAGPEYIRVATNVKKDDGSRAIGTMLDPAGPAIEKINSGDSYYGEATILGKPYMTGTSRSRMDPAGSLASTSSAIPSIKAVTKMSARGGDRLMLTD